MDLRMWFQQMTVSSSVFGWVGAGPNSAGAERPLRHMRHSQMGVILSKTRCAWPIVAMFPARVRSP
jgi:hypothetical protein